MTGESGSERALSRRPATRAATTQERCRCTRPSRLLELIAYDTNVCSTRTSTRTYPITTLSDLGNPGAARDMDWSGGGRGILFRPSLATRGHTYTCAIVPYVCAGYKHIGTQAEVSTVYAMTCSSKKNGITSISRPGCCWHSFTQFYLGCTRKQIIGWVARHPKRGVMNRGGRAPLYWSQNGAKLYKSEPAEICLKNLKAMYRFGATASLENSF